MKIYRYVVQYDGGSAPRPFGDVCSLAICKPMIRRTASVGDWIIGVRSRHHDQVVYVMQVYEILPFDQYWWDSRFEDRRPGASPVPDNIYRPNGSGTLEQVAQNGIHDASNIDNDLSGGNVLLGRRFWYFGSSSPELPDNLKHLKPYCRGHSVHINRKKEDVDITNLESWLKSLPNGIQGVPIDATMGLKAWLSNSKQSGNDSSAKTASAAGCTRRLPTGSSQISRSTNKCNFRSSPEKNNYMDMTHLELGQPNNADQHERLWYALGNGRNRDGIYPTWQTYDTPEGWDIVAPYRTAIYKQVDKAVYYEGKQILVGKSQWDSTWKALGHYYAEVCRP